MIYFNRSKRADKLNQGVTVVADNKNKLLHVYVNGALVDKVPLGEYAVFRPDHDESFHTSKFWWSRNPIATVRVSQRKTS